MNGKLFFTANDGTDGVELWTSDGTPGGTMLVKDIAAGTISSSPLNLTNVNGTLYFTAATSDSGRELWKSDGTSAGTVLADDVYPGADGSVPINLVALGNLVFFQAGDRASGFSQFVSDGTANGTVLLEDLIPGPLNASSIGITLRSDGTLFYCANDPATGNRALFTSNGMPGSSNLIADIDSATAAVNRMLEVNGIIFIFRFHSPSGVAMEQLLEPFNLAPSRQTGILPEKLATHLFSVPSLQRTEISFGKVTALSLERWRSVLHTPAVRPLQ